MRRWLLHCPEVTWAGRNWQLDSTTTRLFIVERDRGEWPTDTLVRPRELHTTKNTTPRRCDAIIDTSSLARHLLTRRRRRSSNKFRFFFRECKRQSHDKIQCILWYWAAAAQPSANPHSKNMQEITARQTTRHSFLHSTTLISHHKLRWVDRFTFARTPPRSHVYINCFLNKTSLRKVENFSCNS